jgi:hypothetical protein
MIAGSTRQLTTGISDSPRGDEPIIIVGVLEIATIVSK